MLYTALFSGSTERSTSKQSSFRCALLRALVWTALVVIAAGLMVLVALPTTGRAEKLEGVPVQTNRAVLAPDYCSFTIVDSPNPGDGENTLAGVAIVSENDVWAVGQKREQAGCRLCALIEHWDGDAWSVITSPITGTTSHLRDVAAISTSDVWAVGSYQTQSGGNVTLILHWDGSTWSIADTSSGGYLEAISAASSSDIWAIGEDCCGGLAMHWDGTAWTIFPTPIGISYAGIFDVAAISPNDAWIVGYRWHENYPQTVTLHWDGTAWTFVDSPNLVVGEDNILTAVAAVASSDVWAVGYYRQHHTGYLTLAMHWDGSAWTVVSTPNLRNSNMLNEVDFVSANDGWAVGTFEDNGSNTGVLHWNGSTWMPVNSPNVNTANILEDVDASAAGVWTVGNSSVAGNFVIPAQTLIERYDYCVPAPTPTAEPTQTPGGPTATEAPPTNTVIATATSTACSITFSDVPPDQPFYSYITCLACRGIISGYADGTFHPGDEVTRGQLSKIVSNSAGYPEEHTYQSFQDIPITSTFYIYIERLATRSIINGYPCGGPGEPCVPYQNLPYFRQGNNATRGQLTKIVCAAFGCSGEPTGQTFEDVPPGSTFYTTIEQLHILGAIGGYPCGGPGEPCGSENLPYFRQSANVTRGQTAKIVSLVFYPNCDPPSRK